MNKAKHYSKVKHQLEIINVLYAFILLVIFQSSGLSHILARGISTLFPEKSFALIIYILAVYLGHYILTFPLNFYGSFIVEHSFSLSKQRLADWAADQVKSFIISVIVAVILLETFYYLLFVYPDTWWLILCGFVVCFNLIFSKLLPVIIIPLFFKYKPLGDDELRFRIRALAERMNIKLLDVFEIDLSKKTLKANAALVGTGSTRRVLLADTLSGKYSHDEIEVILAHEFAHCKLQHMTKLIALNAAVSLALFFLIYKTSLPLLILAHLSSLSDIAALPIVIIYILLFSVITQPVTNFISRRFERAADKMALMETGKPEAFISMMEKLSAQNLADPNPSRIIKIFFYDHPPVAERLDMAKEFQKEFKS